MTNGAALVGRVLLGLLVTGLVAAGCQSDPIAPSDLESGKPSPSSGVVEGVPSSSPSAAVPAVPSAQPAIDVCARVPAEVVRSVVGAATVAVVPEPSPSATSGPAAYRCIYQWTVGVAGTGATAVRLLLSVLPDSGADSPQAAVDTVLGAPITPVAGVGEAAGVDRSGRLGNGFAFLAAAKRSGSTTAAVLVRAPAATSDEKLATLANHLLATL